MIGDDLIHALEKLGLKKGALEDFRLKFNRLENLINSFGRTEVGSFSGYLKGTAGVLSSTTTVPSGDIEGATEAAQDAVGAMIADTVTIDLTYTDATPELKADVKADSISNAYLANMANATFKARNTAGTGDPEDVSAANSRTLLGLGTIATQNSPLPIANGGSGQTAQQTALDALTNVSAATNEHVLTKDTADGKAKFKAAAGGVTNGDSHDHVGGDGAQINHTGLSNIGTNTHAQLDTFVSSKAAASGLASLDGSSKVVQDPANATATPTASKIPIADGSGTLNSWISVGSMYVQPNGFTRAAIQAAIASLGSGGGVVYCPPGTYNIDNSLLIGDGTESSPSTYNNITLLGAGMGGSEFFKGSGSGDAYVGGATVLQWTSAGGGVLVYVRGRITGCKIENIVLDGGNHVGRLIDADRATLLRVNNVLGYHWSGDFSTVIHNNSQYYYSAGSMEQVWTNVHMRNPYGNDAHGLDIASPWDGNCHNVSECTFVGCSFSRSPQPTNVGLRLGYCDHITLLKTFFCTDQLGYTAGYGIQINPYSGYPAYPQDITLHGSPIIGGVHYLGVAHGGTDWTSTVAPAVIFYPYYTADSQIVPPADADGGDNMPTAMCGGHTDHYWYHNGVVTA